jgi:hypothetical protein
MSKHTKADIERMVRAYWKKEAAPRQVRTPRRAPAVEKLATEWLRTTGFDVGTATKLLAQRRAEFDRSAPKAAAAAARRWAGHVKRTQASATAWGSNMMAVAGAAPPGNSFFLDTPVSILASDVNNLQERHIEAGKSFAKVLVDRKSSTVDTVSFIFGFRNAAAMPFVFDFDTLINVSGHLRMSVGAGFVNSGVLTVDARLDVLTATQVSDTRNVGVLATISDGPPFFGGESNERTLSLTRFLTARGIVIDGNSLTLLLVSLVLEFDLDDAHVVADFSTGGFRILCPVVFAARRALPLKASSPLAAGVSL